MPPAHPTAQLGMRNEELGIRNSPPPPPVSEAGGWAAFLIPNSYFLIRLVSYFLIRDLLSPMPP